MISRGDYKESSKSWDDEITLIGTSTPTYDEEGYPVPGGPSETSILANRLPVTSSEHYDSDKQGYTISEAFEVHTIEYNGEQSLRFDGVEYIVRRSYRRIELTELYCERRDVTHG